MEKQQYTRVSEDNEGEQHFLAKDQVTGSEIRADGLSETHLSPLRLFIITIAAIFIAEVVAMVVVYFLEPLPYHLTTLVDAGLMTIFIFPVLYYFSFRPLIRQMEKSWRAEESLLQARQVQERFFDSIDTLIAYMDRDFNFIHVNDAYARADGHDPDYFIGKNHFELYPHPENLRIFKRVVESGEPYAMFEKPFEYPENPERGVTYWDWSLQPVKGSAGRVEGLVLSLLDVTERRRSHDAIRQLSRIVEQTEDTVVVTNCDGVIEYVNPAFERLTGYSKEETLGQNPKLLKSGLHDGDFYHELWETIRQGEVFQSEIANRKKNGELFYEVKTITPLRDIHGQITHFVATGKDITAHKQDEEELRKAYEELEIRVEDRTEELRIANRDLTAEINVRRQTEEALRKSESRLKRAQEIAHLGSWELDLINNRLEWSDEVYRIFGLEPQEFPASYEAFLDLVHPDDRVAVDTAYSSSITSGKDGYEIEHRIIRPYSGELRVVHEKCEHFRDETGEIIRSIGMVHDITERKNAEEQLRYQAALLSNVNDAIVASDAQFNITAWNSSAEGLYGWKSEEVLSRNGVELLRTTWTDTDPDEMRRAIAAAGRWRGEATQMRKDGTRFPVEVSSIVLRDSSGQVTGYISVNRDITARKQAERRLAYLASFPERNPNPVMEVDFDGQIRYANPAASNILPGLEERGLADPRLAELKMIVAEFREGQTHTTSHDVVLGNQLYQVTLSLLDQDRLIRIYAIDITERKQAEEALRESEAKYRNLFENMTEEVHFWELVRDDAGHIKTWRLVDVNPPTLKSWDRATVDEIKGKTTDEIFGPGATDHYMPVVQKIMTEGVSHSYEDYFGHLDKYFRFTSVPLGDHFITTGADITSIKKAEAALRQARDELEIRVQQRTEELAAANRELVKEINERKEIERQLRLQTTAMESAANGIVITTPQGTIQWTNPALVQISGYDSGDLIGQNMRVFRSGQHDESYYRRMWDTILSGEVWRGEITNRRKDGSFYMEEQTITPVRDDHGKITQFISIKQDITERKQAEEALRESEEKFRTLVEWTYDWEIWLDPSGNMVYTSPACERITGYSPEEFRSTPNLTLRLLHPDDRALYQSHGRSVHIESAGAETIEYRIMTRDGKERWIQHVCRPLFGAENRYLGRRISNRDITGRKQAEKDLQERNQKEKILTETIHTMQLDIARDLHDTIGQNISFLRMKLDHLADKPVRKRAEMQSEIRSMAEVANESYDLMRGTLAVLQFENSTDLFRLFTRYAEQIEERSRFSIKFSTRGETRFMSARRMRQLFYVFREILINIEKHANATEVSIEMSWEQDCLNLSVVDNGSGFELDKVQYGSHYGLKFMRERVELLNGSLLIRSATGSGTNIILQVPYE